VTHLVVFRLRAVSDKPEAADHFAYGKKANNLGGNNADGHPLCARHASYLVEHVEGLSSGGLDRRGEAAGVTGGVCDGLEVALEGGHVSWVQISSVHLCTVLQ
jgi:hypothetical protein